MDIVKSASDALIVVRRQELQHEAYNLRMGAGLYPNDLDGIAAHARGYLDAYERYQQAIKDAHHD